MRGAIRAGLVALVLSTSGAVVAPADASEPRAAVTFIGDSTMAGMGPAARQIVADRYDLTFEAKSCRRLVIPSCGRTVQHPNTLAVMHTLAGQLGDAVVIMAGYDDWEIDDAVDQIVAEAERQGVPRVLWVTYRTGVGYVGPGGVSNDATFRRFNDVLEAKLAEHPSLRLADWDAHAAGRAEWFAPDGIHLTPAGALALGTFLADALDTLAVGRCRADRPAAGQPAEATAPEALAAATPSGFAAATPERLADTRAGAPLGSQRTLPVAIAGVDAVPAAATAALVNVTAVDGCAPGYLTAFPCGTAPPLASNLNYVTGETRANLATVQLGADGEICVFASTRADVLVDLVGWFEPGGGQRIVPTPHQRLVDTRLDGPVRPAGSWLAVDAPADMAVVTVTVAEPAQPGFVSVTPTAPDGTCPAAPPPASTLNHRRAQTVANVAAVATGADGRLCVFTWSPAHLVVDLIGRAGSAGRMVAARSPVRVLDTRPAATGTPALAAGSAVAVPSPAGVDADGLVLNVTATDAAAPGFVTAFPAATDGTCDPALAPTASSLNPVPGPPTPAMVVVPTGGEGRACLAASSAMNLVVDVTATLTDAG